MPPLFRQITPETRKIFSNASKGIYKKVMRESGGKSTASAREASRAMKWMMGKDQMLVPPGQRPPSPATVANLYIAFSGRSNVKSFFFEMRRNRSRIRGFSGSFFK